MNKQQYKQDLKDGRIYRHLLAECPKCGREFDVGVKIGGLGTAHGTVNWEYVAFKNLKLEIICMDCAYLADSPTEIIGQGSGNAEIIAEIKI
jgi:hypothetical protein